MEEKRRVLVRGDTEIAAGPLDTGIAQLVSQRDTAIAEKNDTSERLIALCNAVWGLVYPDDLTSWEYAAQVERHIALLVKEQRGRIAALDAENAQLRAALKPFADYGRPYINSDEPADTVYVSVPTRDAKLTLGDFQRAHDALHGTDAPEA